MSEARRKRKRRGYVRPSRAKQKVGWSLAALAALAGTTPRLVRMYIERGLVRAPPFAGSATRYGRAQLVRLVAARRIRFSENLELKKIAARLDAMTAEELEACAVTGLTAGPLATALGVSLPPAAPSQSSPPAQDALRVSANQRWARLELAVGLELHIRDDASAPVLELAKRIWKLSVGGE